MKIVTLVSQHNKDRRDSCQDIMKIVVIDVKI